MTAFVSSYVERIALIPSTATFAEATEKATFDHFRPRFPVLAEASIVKSVHPERKEGTESTIFGEAGLVGANILMVAAGAVLETQSGVEHTALINPPNKFTLFQVPEVSAKMLGSAPLGKEAVTLAAVTQTQVVVSVIAVTVK